ncbi:hypothetical protein LVD17_23940 [Fulvivirga ulvae]|uniref:hypothetical protein n=1 Tax=Fulvivirga ulvae TaxID=2904245 RepID=UPI001F36AE4A|nr:hypothetical protein [Fulvivirga ulvae]UII31348.1 hypothetical protein LVD17_23940 [Fulvivirga ulvae]
MPGVKISKKLFFGKTILITASVTLVITILIVYITGLASHRTIIENSFISLSILCIALFTFVTTGLYNGFNVYDDLSHKLKFKWRGNTISDGMSFHQKYLFLMEMIPVQEYWYPLPSG